MRRWKKWLRRTAVALVVVSAVYFGYRGVRHVRGTMLLNELRAALDQDDPEWRLDPMIAARAKSLPPDDMNIAKLAGAIHGDTPRDFIDQFPPFDSLPWPFAPVSNRLPPAAQLADARALQDRCRAVIERSVHLGSLSGGGIVIPSTPNPLDRSLGPLQRLRTAGELLQFNAVLLSTSGQPNRAMKSCRAALKITKAFSTEPTHTGTLIRLAVTRVAVRATEQVLAYAEPLAELAELQAELFDEADQPVLEDGFRGERAAVEQLIEYLRANQSLRDAGSDGLAGSLALFFYSNLKVEEQTVSLERHAKFIEIARGPSHLWMKRIVGVGRADLKIPIVRDSDFATEAVAQSVLSVHSRLRTLAVGIACERYRRANGRWPATLADIPTTILAAVPADPYTGEPLKYRVLEDGIVVYAVGEDCADNGGRVADKNPKPGEDVGTRLWSPEFRRAAPRPADASE